MGREKQRIAILGGGVGAMVAAWELTSAPGWQSRYEVDVYQLGWRLGGKGASGRRSDAHERIEEHGLHVWMGFYENAFRVMREAYAELARPSSAPLASVEDAFKPHSFVVWADRGAKGWTPWAFDFPRNGAVPGAGGELPSWWDYLELLVDFVIAVFEGHALGRRAAQVMREAARPDEGLLGELGRLGRGVRRLFDATVDESAWLGVVRRAASAAATPIAALGVHVVRESLRRLGARERRRDHPALLAITRLLREFRGWLHGAAGTAADDTRRLVTIVDLAISNALGIVDSGLLWDGERALARLDELDYRAWLRPYCLLPETVDSAPVRAFYALVFCEDCGIAAGATLVCAFRMCLTYKGALFWKMQAGMGDVVFAPLYQALRARGVRFHFFHRVVDLRAEGGRVRAIDLAIQATTRDGGPYEPLVDVKGLPCWPSAPRYEQLVEGEALRAGGHDLESAWTTWRDVGRRTLELGEDFDQVVLGIPIAALPHVAAGLLAAQPEGPLAQMTRHVTSTPTQAVQLWLRRDLAALGWGRASPVMTSFAEPYDTWADMTHLLPRESWPGPDAPRSLAYLCCFARPAEPTPPPFTDPDFPRRAREAARADALAWLDEGARVLWPNATTPEGRFDWDQLVAPSGTTGVARLDAQYFRRNVDPTELYVRTEPGTTKYRRRAWESGFHNLFLAGDWVKTALNGGCVEAAAMAGMQASHAICGYPTTIVGDPLPPLTPAIPPRVTAGLPRFIERGGDLILRPPFLQSQTRLYSFLLPSSLAALQDLCDRTINAPLGERRYVPLGPLSALVCANIRQLQSADPIDRDKGRMTELDVGLWVPVLRGATRGGRFVPEALLWFLPYIFVDSAPAMATGREIYGFPKEAGELVIPARPDREPDVISARALVLPTMTPQTWAESRPLVEVVADADGALERDFDNAAGLVAAIRRALGEHLADVRWGPKLVASLLGDLLTGTMSMVFLQQFRDVEVPDRAAYQAIVEAPARVVAFAGAGLLRRHYAVKIHSYASHPIAADLGYASGTLTPLFQNWVEFGFTMERGAVVWSGGRGWTRR